MDEMTWTDPQLKARYERNLKAMEQRRAAHPELFNRPIVTGPRGARVCRPAEVVKELI